ncbi:GNAT family N-acetyltransferase [Sphingoaurantiacus capsulatus]|uniref:GNAT family N-acetyltransferase n=1 Tax=Sphingoaurantiacus capsulatus TaxID=1771310 RepID=A0ABV7X4H8_9SPHN
MVKSVTARETLVRFSIRPERDEQDRRFMESLNPRLTDVIEAPTHSASEVKAFQQAFTATAWAAETAKSATFLAVDEADNRIGYINVREGSDDVLGERCGYIALLAVAHEFEGHGVATSLVREAERWAREMGFSRLALDVFASNEHAFRFYKQAGFQPETVRVIKRL